MIHHRATTRRSFLQGIAALGASTLAASVWQQNAQAALFNLAQIADAQVDATPALQRAMDLAARNQLTFHIPQGTYLVTKTLVAPSNLTMLGHGATLRTAISDHGDSGRAAPTILIKNARNVTIRGLRVDGRRADFGDTEYKHCVSIQGSDSVRIEDCVFFNAKGDGLTLNDLQPGTHNTNITVRRTTCSGNHRLGLAVTDAENALFEDCVFTGTKGTSPMAGVDIEPDRGDCRINNVVFRRCDMSENGLFEKDGAGINIMLYANSTAFQGNIKLERCTIRQNGIHGVLCYRGRAVTIADCEISGNASSGIEIRQDTNGFVIRGGSIAKNAVHGIWAIKDVGETLSNLEIRGVSIRDNSQSWLNHYDGIHLQGDCRNTAIANCTISGSHRYGLWLGNLLDRVDLSTNNLRGNSAGAIFPIL